jgi:hypothetical protein
MPERTTISRVVAAATFKAELKQTDSGEMFDLQLVGDRPDAASVDVLVQISVAHGLPELGGGLYDQQASVVGGGTVSHLGGLTVPPDKFDSVVADLRTRGFEIQDPA